MLCIQAMTVAAGLIINIVALGILGAGAARLAGIIFVAQPENPLEMEAEAALLSILLEVEALAEAEIW